MVLTDDRGGTTLEALCRQIHNSMVGAGARVQRCGCGNRDTYRNPNIHKIICFRGSRRALIEVAGRATLEEAASCDPGTRRKETLTAG